MHRQSWNFDDQVGISSEHENIATEKNGPNVTPVVVSALQKAQQELDEGTQICYQYVLPSISSNI